MSRLSAGFGFLLAMAALLGSTGCDPQATPQPEPDPRINMRLDEIQAQLLAVQEQISTINTPTVSAPSGSLTLTPVVPVESMAAPKTVKNRISHLAQRPRVITKSSSSKKTKSAKYLSKNKKYIRVPVSPAAVQQALKNAGFNPGKIDGKVGERTVAAIRMFQRNEGLKVDGVVGRATWARLKTHVKDGDPAVLYK